MLWYSAVAAAGLTRKSAVPSKKRLGTVFVGYVTPGFHGHSPTAAFNSGCVLAARRVPPPPIEWPMIAMRPVSIFPTRGLPERVFSPLSVVTASVRPMARDGGCTFTLASPLAAVSTVIVTNPCDARKVPHWLM